MKGRVEVVQLRSAALAQNPWEDPAERPLVVYLPPGYDGSGERYPSVYFLHGFTGSARGWLNVGPFSPTVPERIDVLIAAGQIPPVVGVFPDGWTRLGGSQWRNSSGLGRYGDYVVQDVVGEVDRRYRTLARAGSRALIGKSSGGYGALHLGTLHPDVFGHLGSHSGDAYFEYCYLPDFPKAAEGLLKAGGVSRWWEELQRRIRETRMRGDDHPVLNTLAMAAAYSPEPGAPLNLTLPFDPTTARIDEAVWRRWLAEDPVRFLVTRRAALARLTSVFIDCGTRDEYSLRWGARMLAAQARETGVSTAHEEFEDGHSGTSYRYEASLRFLAPRLQTGP